MTISQETLDKIGLNIGYLNFSFFQKDNMVAANQLLRFFSADELRERLAEIEKEKPHVR